MTSEALERARREFENRTGRKDIHWLDTSEIDEAKMSDKDEAYYALAESQLRNKQVGGDHYKKHAIQPWDVIDSYGLDFYTGNVLKYVLRQKDNRLQDLEKAKHYLEKAIEMEKAR